MGGFVGASGLVLEDACPLGTRAPCKEKVFRGAEYGRPNLTGDLWQPEAKVEHRTLERRPGSALITSSGGECAILPRRFARSWIHQWKPALCDPNHCQRLSRRGGLCVVSPLMRLRRLRTCQAAELGFACWGGRSCLRAPSP